MSTSLANRQAIGISLLSVITLTLSGGSAARAAYFSDPDPLTKQAFELCKEGKLQEARELETQAVSKNPNDWLAHEALAYFSWLQGDVVKATSEAQRAAVLAPDQDIVFTNLGQIYEHIYQYRDAIPEYDRATRIAPDNWVPWIGLARAFVLNNNPQDGMAVLNRMEAEKGHSFDWYFQIGRTYLNMDRPDLALAPLAKARSAARAREQKADVAVQTLLASLRNNQKPSSRIVAEDVFNSYHPQDHELYIRAAALLVPAGEPASGKRFLKTASKNLTAPSDGDVFFKVGRIFEEKAATISAQDAGAGSEWLSNAESSYRHAVDLDTTKAAYHFALAGVLDRQSKTDEALAELVKAQSFDSSDKLAPYLVSHAKGGQLTEVAFNIDGVGCGCKINLIQHAIEQVGGVKLVNLVHEKPFRGTMLIDQSVTPAVEALTQGLKTVFPFEFKDEKKIPGVSAVVCSSRPVESTADAVKIARALRSGEPLQFPKPQVRNGLGKLHLELADVVADKTRLAGKKNSAL